MRKLGAISLLMLYLLTHTEMHQLMRLPVLFNHYQEHRMINHDISFPEYISLHYLAYDDHSHNHEELPFKHKHCEIIHIVLAVVPEVIPSEFKPQGTNSRVGMAYEPQFHYASRSASIWQPPRQL